ncbi:MAG: hypothetical protein PHH06_01295 [Candidatus Gracilibacteria bacterium]|nr:hypothetical protein [Candidatus Gracilibacteria bacterium]
MNLTPAMQQFYELKEQNPDSILFFRMGDFYEMFDEDAHIAHKVLGINITSRNKNADKPQPLAGIPYHAKDKYLPQLVNAGYKVAIAEQVSDPNLKGIVKREIVRVVTPSTLSLEGETYKSNDISNFIVAIIESDGNYGISLLDPSTGVWKTGEIVNFDLLAGELYKISPKEVILEKKLFGDQKIKEVLQKKYSLNIYYFDAQKNPKEKLIKHFGVKNLEGFSLEKLTLAQKASSLILEYLESTQKTDLSYLDSIGVISFTNYMNLDETTIRSLDLLYNMGSKSATLGTVFGVLDETKTSMGKRYLREQIIRPLQNLEEIEKRHSIIEEFLKNSILLDKVTLKLREVSDLDNILSRLALGRANPRDLLNLKRSLQTILEVYELIKSQGSEKLVRLLEVKPSLSLSQRERSSFKK